MGCWIWIWMGCTISLKFQWVYDCQLENHPCYAAQFTELRSLLSILKQRINFQLSAYAWNECVQSSKAVPQWSSPPPQSLLLLSVDLLSATSNCDAWYCGMHWRCAGSSRCFPAFLFSSCDAPALPWRNAPIDCSGKRYEEEHQCEVSRPEAQCTNQNKSLWIRSRTNHFTNMPPVTRRPTCMNLQLEEDMLLFRRKRDLLETSDYLHLWLLPIERPSTGIADWESSSMRIRNLRLRTLNPKP